MNNHVLNENETDVVNSYIGKKSLCMLLLASSILFYTMAKSKNQRKIIPRLYTLIISLLLIFYAIILGSFALAEFYFHINDLINIANKLNLSNVLDHLLNVKYFYLIIGSLFTFIFVFIAFVLLRFDK
jgi:hypothetical protein